MEVRDLQLVIEKVQNANKIVVLTGVFWNGCYVQDICSMDEAEQAMLYAQTHGWNGKLYFGINTK